MSQVILKAYCTLISDNYYHRASLSLSKRLLKDGRDGHHLLESLLRFKFKAVLKNFGTSPSHWLDLPLTRKVDSVLIHCPICYKMNKSHVFLNFVLFFVCLLFLIAVLYIIFYAMSFSFHGLTKAPERMCFSPASSDHWLL